MKSVLLASAMLFAIVPAFAQETAPEAAAHDGFMQDEIIVTATKRSQALSDVPIAISAVTAESLQNSGASDIRQLNQLSPSLLVSSSSSETSGGAARIRGIGTVGDNAGLEASVAVFVDGVYRSRTGAGLTELGEIERIEVLRGPQGTLFGRNASAGLINVVTAKPKFDVGGSAEVTYGNFDYWRLAGGFTGGIIDNVLAARLDGVYVKRDGFITDVISGATMNDRDRWMLRGQLLFTPNDDMEIRLIGDYAKRQESCCAGTFQPFRTVTFNPATQQVNISPNNSIVNIIRGLGGTITDDTWGRKTAITPGRDYDNNVKDWGLSGELNWDLGFGSLTSITAYRDWKTLRNQDADFTSLDILEIEGNETRFRTFSQELRLNGTAFDDRLDWLVGGYYADETLNYTSHTRYGADYTKFANCLVANSLNASVPGLLSPTSNGCLNPTLAAAIVSNPNLPASLRTPVAIFGGFAVPGVYGYDAVATLVGQPGKTLSNTGIVEDRYRQSSRNYAFFTHNVFEIIPDSLSLTLGARYTNEKKTLDANLDSDNTLCAAIAASPLASLASAPCVVSSFDYTGTSSRSESKWTGTAVLSWKPVDGLMTYASYAKGYKSGGFNMDRTSLNAASIQMTDLQFGAETVDSFEVGAKFDTRGFTLNVAAFRSIFDQFQLNAFNGVNFVVENIQSCGVDLNGGDRDFAGLPVNGVPLTQAQAAATGRCNPDDVKAGVTSTGFEIEAAVYPAPNLMFNLGMTYAQTKYRNNLTGVGGKPLGTAFFNLPGNQLSNAPEYVMTGAMTFTPPVTDTLSALFYLDYRFQSGIETGSDLFPEKYQQAVMVVNGRIGLSGPDRKWSIEAWAQNLLDTNYQQVGYNAPLLGSGTIAQTARGGPAANQLFGAFLAEPRTFGLTLRTKF